MFCSDAPYISEEVLRGLNLLASKFLSIRYQDYLSILLNQSFHRLCRLLAFLLLLPIVCFYKYLGASKEPFQTY